MENDQQGLNNTQENLVKGLPTFTASVPEILAKEKADLAELQGKNILVVAHGGVNRVILCHVLGMDLKNLIHLDQAYGCMNIIDYFDELAVVRLVNST